MIFLGLFIFIVCLIAFNRKKNTKKQDHQEEQFWDRENRANSTRRQDISGLPYINISLDKFPIGICENEELQHYEHTLQKLSGSQILNLGTQTNTDLKLKYGPANLDFLSNCEQHFITLCHTLVSYAECLLMLGYEDECIHVLEYGIACGSDLSKNYLLLADFYKAKGRTDDIKALIAQAKELDSLMKNSIVQHLSEKLDD